MTEFEFIERSDSSCPSIVKMWVLLEGGPRAIKLRVSLDKVEDLDDFALTLTKGIRDLEAVDPQKLVFLDGNNKQYPPGTNIKALAETTTDVNPLSVRYPISDVNIKVTFVYGQKQGKRDIPHTSDSFGQLKAFARGIFKELEEGTIYFVANHGTEIWDAYNFNTVVKSQTTQDDKNVELRLKVLVEGRKKYSDWKLKDVFRDILKNPTYNSLSDMPVLDMTEFPPLDPPLSQSQLKNFVAEVKVKLSSFRDEFGNETKNRVYIDAFMTHAVDYTRTQINESVRLDVEQGLIGSHGHGPVDYWVKLIQILLLLCEAKAEDMNQGSAQVIVQTQSGIEQLSKLGYKELLIYGIATTGKLWRFFRWSGTSENPEVHVSKEYSCSFKGELADEKEILTYIAQILTAQVYLHDKSSEHPSKRVKVNEK